ncbi:hypothetical protein FB451DRAFT_1181360 [Mycena latifolia]|nr:hypothetical protein FB451DRAFT_1181360 [Mycena latifolia]
MAFVAFRLLALAALATQFATATPAPTPVLVTVVNPIGTGSGPQETLSASIVGVDNSNGHTTYVLAGNQMDGSSTDALETVTLVAGSDYESFTVAFNDGSLTFAGGFDFTIQSGNAIVTGLDVSTSIPTASKGGLVLDLPPTGAPGGPRPTNSAQRTAAAGFGALETSTARSSTLLNIHTNKTAVTPRAATSAEDGGMAYSPGGLHKQSMSFDSELNSLFRIDYPVRLPPLRIHKYNERKKAKTKPGALLRAVRDQSLRRRNRWHHKYYYYSETSIHIAEMPTRGGQAATGLVSTHESSFQSFPEDLEGWADESDI